MRVQGQQLDLSTFTRPKNLSGGEGGPLGSRKYPRERNYFGRREEREREDRETEPRAGLSRYFGTVIQSAREISARARARARGRK